MHLQKPRNLRGVSVGGKERSQFGFGREAGNIQRWAEAEKDLCKACLPLYSMPHLSFTMTCFPVSSLRKGLGLTGTDCKVMKILKSM